MRRIAEVSSRGNGKQDQRLNEVLSSDEEGLLVGHTSPEAGLQLCGGLWVVLGRCARHTAAGTRW